MSPAPAPPPSPFLSLPPELLLHLLSYCPLSTLLNLSRVSSSLHSVITSHSLPAFARRLAYSPLKGTSTSFKHDRWSWGPRCSWAERVRERWDGGECGAEILGGLRGEWDRKCMPVLKVWEGSNRRKGRIVLGRGPELELWEVASDRNATSERVPMLPLGVAGGDGSGKRRLPDTGGLDDITGIAVLDTGKGDELVVSRVSGAVQRIRVEEPRWKGRQWQPGMFEETARYGTTSQGSTGRSNLVQTIAAQGNTLAMACTSRPVRHRLPPRRRRLSSTTLVAPLLRDPLALASVPSQLAHSLAITSLSAPWSPPTVLSLSSKPWSLALSSSHAAVGTHSLALYALGSTGEPLSAPSTLSSAGSKTAIYSLCFPSPLSTTLHPSQTLIAASYDSHTRIYDLRSPSASGPIMDLTDPWSDDPCYSVASGGPMGAYVVVGAARNATLRVWDVRSASREASSTWFAPGKDRSPVYGVAVEYGRVWGVTERRGFGLEFEGRLEREGAYGVGWERVARYGHGEGEGGKLVWSGR